MPIPILMYHVVGNRPPGAAYPELWVTPTAFASEMRALRRADFHAVTLAAAVAAWRHGAPLPRRPVVVSFDDGYLGDYTHARPVLRRLGWPGVLNLELDNVRTGDLSAREVRGLIAAGWEVDSHTIDHPDLTTLGPGRLRYELVASRRELRTRFRVPADFFCYPAGRYDAGVVAAVKAAGYLAATTTTEGYAEPSNPYTLDRIRVQGSDTAATLLARLAAERPRS
jgi:peptidoglycan/xylan/chitin deacetylase (PgdA/CDA1 family)